ncbi:MAG: nitroreductase family protein [Candidatus Micrarchaeota archaeon]
MDVSDAIRGRRSIRAWKDKPLSAEQVAALKGALNWAPSACNMESRKFYFVFDEKKKAAVCAAMGRQLPPKMPLVVVGCTDAARLSGRFGAGHGHDMAIMDVSASIENMLLAAHSMELGTVWAGAIDREAVAKAVAAPEGITPVVVVPIGYPDEKPNAPARRGDTIEEMR